MIQKIKNYIFRKIYKSLFDEYGDVRIYETSKKDRVYYRLSRVYNIDKLLRSLITEYGEALVKSYAQDLGGNKDREVIRYILTGRVLELERLLKKIELMKKVSSSELQEKAVVEETEGL